MIKLLLYGAIIYLGYRVFKYVSGEQMKFKVDNKPEAKEDENKDYSKYEIQDADFTDIDE